MAQNRNYSSQPPFDRSPSSSRRMAGSSSQRDQRPHPDIGLPFSSPAPADGVLPNAPGPAASRVTLLGKIARNWHIWSLASLAVVGGVGVMSAVSLFRIPNLPNCRAIFWPTASATTRVQCAEAFAGQRTVNGYLDAIKLVDSLPDDHPLRADINQRIETWAEQVLQLAELTFQEGDLSEAIAIARRIPTQTAAADLVSDQIDRWNQVWEAAEDIYEAAEAELQQRDFQEAFAKANQLLDVGNRYWETTKYDEITVMISDGRRDLNRLGQARRLAKRNTVKSILEAVEIAKAIVPESPLYAESRELIQEFSRSLLPLVDQALDREDALAASDILSKVPPEADLAAEIADYRTIIQAEELSWQGGITGLEGAVVRLQSIGSDRPLYGRARQLIGLWQQEIEGRAYLSWARQIANPGTIGDLQAAVVEARQVPRDNPVWDEAQGQISDWQRQIETIQDQPFLDRAELLSQQGDLKNAIASAEMIQPGRALYARAQNRIDSWRTQVQRTEDRPILTRAQQLADSGDLQQAISVASQIRSGRVLYADAQQDISRWRSRLEGQRQLQRAYEVAQLGTPNALVDAIRLAQQVPSGSPQRSEAVSAADGWSWDILSVAEAEAPFNSLRAIEVASQVPERTAAYAPARLKIEEWQARQPVSQPMENSL